MEPKDNIRLSSLDSLRGIAAIMLVIFHVHGIPKLVIPDFFTPLMEKIGFGVPLFYALSAFSLLLGYSDKIFQEGGLLHFYSRRAFRILPLFFVILSIFLLKDKFESNALHSFLNLAANYLCVFGLLPGLQSGIVWASWSVGVEVIFYAFFPLLAILSKSLRGSIIVFVGSFCFSILSVGVLYNRFEQNSPGIAYQFITTQFVFFAAGLFSYQLAVRLRDKLSQSHNLDFCFSQSLPVVSVVFLLLVWLTPFGKVLESYSISIQSQAIALLILFSSILLKHEFVIFKNRLLQKSGKISYSLYLINPLVIFYLNKTGAYNYIYNNITSSGLAFIVCCLTTFIILFPVCILSYELIEVNGIKLGSNLLSLAPKCNSKNNVDSEKNKYFISSNKFLLLLFICIPWITWLGILLLGSIQAVSIQSPSLADNKSNRELVIEIKSSKSGTAQIYYDLGTGLSEANSSKAVIHGGANHETLRFPIPEGEVTALRFDPLEDAGEIEVRSIALTSGNGAAGLSLAQVIPGQQISKSEIRDGALFIETTPDAIDPQLTIPKEALLSPSLATNKTSRDLIIELKSSKSGTAQIYYDLGTGLSEANSSKAVIYGGSDYETLHFSIPSGNFVGLRFDPFNDSGEIELRSIAMQSGESFSKIPLEALTPQNEISKFELRDGTLFIQATLDAKDPQINILIK